MIITRDWAMPSADTFSIAPIARLLDRWLGVNGVIADPFARNSRRGTLTNDLNPGAHEGRGLGGALVPESCHAVLFDPPYSPRQISEVYQSVGIRPTTEDTQNARLYKVVRDGLALALMAGGVAISCGWNSAGFGKERGFLLEEVLLVAHGGAHNDTIVTVERKMAGRLL